MGGRARQRRAAQVSELRSELRIGKACIDLFVKPIDDFRRRVLPPPDNFVGSVAMKAFRACGLEYPRTVVFSDSPHMRLNLLATGRFLSIFPVSTLRFLARRAEVRVLPVNLPLVRVPVGIVTLKNRTLGPVAQLFIEHAREVARPLTKQK